MKNTSFYIYLTRFLPLLALLLLFGGCASNRNMRHAPRPVAASVPGTELNTGNRSKVRSDETIKAYHVNRYVDPNDPNIMHEGHVVYRKESGGTWNLMPNEPVNLPFGPITELADPGDNPLFAADMEQHQEDMMGALIEANDVLADENAKLRKELAKLRPEEKEPPLPTSDPDDAPASDTSASLAPPMPDSLASKLAIPAADVPPLDGNALAALPPSADASSTSATSGTGVPPLSGDNSIKSAPKVGVSSTSSTSSTSAKVTFGRFPATSPTKTISLVPLTPPPVPKASPSPTPMPGQTTGSASSGTSAPVPTPTPTASPPQKSGTVSALSPSPSPPPKPSGTPSPATKTSTINQKK